MEIGEICGRKTKRTMRLKRHEGEVAHRSHRSTQMPFGVAINTDRAVGAADGHRSFACGELFILGAFRARPEGTEVHSPGQAKRHPGY